MLGGLQSPSGYCRAEKNLLPLPGIELQFLGHSAINLVTILTQLSQLKLTKNLLTSTVFLDCKNNYYILEITVSILYYFTHFICNN
jgi:hypothetical protein